MTLRIARASCSWSPVRAVVEDLDAQLVARPVDARGGGGDAHGQRPFVADGKLDQDLGQGLVGQGGQAQAGLARKKRTEPSATSWADSSASRISTTARRHCKINDMPYARVQTPTLPILAPPSGGRLRELRWEARHRRTLKMG